MNTKRVQTPQEEVANTITHAVGILFAFIAMPGLWNKANKMGSVADYWAVGFFGVGLLAVYVSSTFYHAIQSQPLKDKLQILDHVSIFFLIGGTYLPLVWKYTDVFVATIFTGAQWMIISIGAILKLFFTGKHEKVSLFVYLLLGWSVIFLIKPMILHMSFEVFKWVLIGGISYTTGVIFYRMDHQKYAHAIWHLFVLGGTVSHYIAIASLYS